MKKIFLLGIAMLITTVAFAQQDKPSVEYTKKVWNDVSQQWEYEYDYRPDLIRKVREKNNHQITFNCKRLVTGVSIIGGGVSLYLVGSAAIAQRINSVNKDIQEMTNGHRYSADELASKQKNLQNLDKTKRIITWVSGAAVLSGTIVALCSIKSEKVTPEGIVVGQNMFLKDCGAGLAFSYKF